MFLGYEFYSHKHRKTLGDIGIQLRGDRQELAVKNSDHDRPFCGDHRSTCKRVLPNFFGLCKKFPIIEASRIVSTRIPKPVKPSGEHIRTIDMANG